MVDLQDCSPALCLLLCSQPQEKLSNLRKSIEAAEEAHAKQENERVSGLCFASHNHNQATGFLHVGFGQRREISSLRRDLEARLSQKDAALEEQRAALTQQLEKALEQAKRENEERIRTAVEDEKQRNQDHIQTLERTSKRLSARLEDMEEEVSLFQCSGSISCAYLFPSLETRPGR